MYGLTATDNISSARWSCTDLLLLLLSENRSRHLSSGEGSGLWMDTTTWCLASGNFGRGWDFIYSAVSFPLWLCGHVLNMSLLRFFTLQWTPEVGFCTLLGPMCLPLCFRFPFGTNFLKMYALQCLTLKCPSPLWDPTFNLNLLS